MGVCDTSRPLQVSYNVISNSDDRLGERLLQFRRGTRTWCSRSALGKTETQVLLP
jgi:hypothetical protein